MARCSGDMEADPNAFTSVGHTPAAAKQASETSERCDMRSSAALDLRRLAIDSPLKPPIGKLNKHSATNSEAIWQRIGGNALIRCIIKCVSRNGDGVVMVAGRCESL